jgi:PAS domain-containing protein
MSIGVGRVFSTEVGVELPGEPGIYTWDIRSNLVFADGAVARLFGVDPGDAKHGLPLDSYLDKVHPEDRPALAKAITDTIVADIPQQQVYRVRSFEHTYQAVAAFGRAFHTRDGTLVAYSGIMIIAENEQQDANH